MSTLGIGILRIKSAHNHSIGKGRIFQIQIHQEAEAKPVTTSLCQTKIFLHEALNVLSLYKVEVLTASCKMGTTMVND